MAGASGKKDYVSVVYNEKDKPFTRYPDLLAKHLVAQYRLPPGRKILDLGCGRGEFLRGFIRCGLKGCGVDGSLAARLLCPEAEILQADLETPPLPYADNCFDIIFSKSVLEHFYHPERLVKEIYRILKPGGLVITMTPDWQSIYKIFYDDCTHRRPFTLASLRTIFMINGFQDVEAQKFRQLPFVWGRRWLNPLPGIISLVTPRCLSSRSKLVRFSKEVMLLCSAVKPEK